MSSLTSTAGRARAALALPHARCEQGHLGVHAADALPPAAALLPFRCGQAPNLLKVPSSPVHLCRCPPLAPRRTPPPAAPLHRILRPADDEQPHASSSSSSWVCHAERGGRKGGPAPSGSALGKINTVYLAIVGVYGLLFLFKSPYIFAVLTIITILPQNSNVTSLNALVTFLYETGLFMNYGEAVNCARLVTWLSILCCLASFAINN